MKPTSGLDLLEQAFGLLRRAPASAWLVYLLGTGLFTTSFLFFWEDMTHSPTATERLGPQALLLAVLLLTMFASQAIFSIRLRQVLEPGEPTDLLRLVLLQCLIQPTKLIVLPAAAVALLPFAPTAAFYQHCAALRASDVASLRVAIGQAWQLTRRGGGQTWVALGLFGVFGFLVWINLFVFLGLLPQLSHMFLGIESDFSRAGANFVLTGTFFRISVAITYCVIEPLWRAAQVLRSFECESITTGADLLRGLRLAAPSVALLLCCSAYAEQAIPPVQLDQSIEQTLRSPEFAWRTPRALQQPQVPGWLEALQNGTRTLFRAINNGLRSFFDWLGNMVDRQAQFPSGSAAPAGGLRTSSYLLIALCVALILGLLIRQWQAKTPEVTIAESISPAVVELADETILPTDRPEDEWTQLGRELLTQGDTRLALRALYLGCLAHLARQQWIHVHRGKSNLDYLSELRRRAKGYAGVESSFRDNLHIYERSWYGEHLATPETIEAFLANVDRIKSHA